MLNTWRIGLSDSYARDAPVPQHTHTRLMPAKKTTSRAAKAAIPTATAMTAFAALATISLSPSKTDGVGHNPPQMRKLPDSMDIAGAVQYVKSLDTEENNWLYPLCETTLPRLTLCRNQILQAIKSRYGLYTAFIQDKSVRICQVVQRHKGSSEIELRPLPADTQLKMGANLVLV